MRRRVYAQDTAIKKSLELFLSFQWLDIWLRNQVKMYVGMFKCSQKLAVAFLLQTRAKVTLCNGAQVDGLTLILWQLLDHIFVLLIGGSDNDIVVIFGDLLNAGFFFLFWFLAVGETRQLLFDLFDSLEGEVVLGHLLQFLNVVLDIVHGHIKTTL